MNAEESRKVLDLCGEFEEHLDRFEQHEISQEHAFNKLVEAQRVNTEAQRINTESIYNVTNSVDKLVRDTKSIVQLHKDFEGAARLGSGLQKFLIWVLKWGAIGTGIATAVLWITEHFGKIN